jgi:hypothetical protein
LLVEYKAVAMDITIERETVSQSGQANSAHSRSVSASLSEDNPPSPNPGNYTIKSKANVVGTTPKASALSGDKVDEEEQTATFFPNPEPDTKYSGKSFKTEKEKPFIKSESVSSLRQVFDTPEAKLKGSNSNLDFSSKRAKDGKQMTKQSSKEELSKQKSKEDLVKMELENSGKFLELQKQNEGAKKFEQESPLIVPVGTLLC